MLMQTSYSLKDTQNKMFCSVWEMFYFMRESFVRVVRTSPYLALQPVYKSGELLLPSWKLFCGQTATRRYKNETSSHCQDQTSVSVMFKI